MAVQRRNVFTANRREIYWAGYWTTYRFQLALEVGRLESILKVVHYRGVEGMRRAGNNMSPAVIPSLPYPKSNRCTASRDSICRSYDQGLWLKRADHLVHAPFPAGRRRRPAGKGACFFARLLLADESRSPT